MQGCNDAAKRECVWRLFEERELDVLVLRETKFNEMAEWSLGKVLRRASSE